MQFNGVNNKEHKHSLVVSGFLHMHMCQNSMCSLFEAFLHVLCEECQLIIQAVFPIPSHSLSTVYSLLQVPVPFPVRGLIAELLGFASHRRSLHLEAGC